MDSGIVATTGMLIRRPPTEVFQAIVDPAVTTHFWFTHSSGKLAEGRRVRWEWAMYGVSFEVDVRELAENRRIVMLWPASAGEGQTRVVWTFEPLEDDKTFVTVTIDGFEGDPHTVADRAVDAAEGFTIVLAGMKAWLEHGIELNLVADRHPELVQRDR